MHKLNTDGYAGAAQATKAQPAPGLRGRMLDKAKELTMGDRNESYGEPYENMKRAADVFNAITGRDLSASEISTVQEAIKLARRKTSPTKADNYVDDMAYVGITAECVAREKGRME
tara:strand:+ start:11304 stop:11651 length:348 start_codon:yes stop_codon:yes gene_type:complete